MAFKENPNATMYAYMFSKAMDQMFLTFRGAVQCYFRVTLGVASVFVHVVSRPGWVAWS